MGKMTEKMNDIVGLIAAVPGTGSLAFASLASGAYVGYCDAHNIPISRDARAALAIGLPAAQGCIFGGLTLLSGISCASRADGEEIASATLKYGAAGTLLGSIETLVGYCIGTTAGYLTR